MNNPWLPQKHRILNIIEETDLEPTSVVEFGDPQVRYGQFFQLSLPKIGGAPISVSNFTDPTVEFMIHRVGTLTSVLSDLRAEDDIYIRGPYGNGLLLEEFKGKHVAVIAGGTGVSPVHSILHHYLSSPQDCRDVYVIAGFQDAQHVLFENDLRQWWQAKYLHTALALDHGEREGFQGGFAMNYVKDIPFQDFGEEYVVIIVGSLAIMQFTAQECMKYGATEDHIYVSFERKMSCALGKCEHCKINEMYVCLEGPVFPYAKVKGLVDQEVNDMSQDMSTNALHTNCFRQSKARGEYMLQMCVPGGLIQAKYLSFVEHLVEIHGDGTFHFGSRQCFTIPDVKYESIDAVNKELKDYLGDVGIAQCGVKMETDAGFPTTGVRNAMTRIGGTHCIKANINTQDMAKKIEQEVFPSHHHTKATVAGCPNGCAKGCFNDFRIIGLTKSTHHGNLCIGCGSRVKTCEFHATGVFSLKNDKIEKDTCCCVGCGECMLVCPTNTMQRSPKPSYRILIGGRTGKQYPRMGKTFVDLLSEDAVLAILRDWQNFSAEMLEGQSCYLHGGHLIDMVGYETLRGLMLKEVKLNPEARIAESLYFTETEYRGRIYVKPVK